jgi:hypothetical protein
MGILLTIFLLKNPSVFLKGGGSHADQKASKYSSTSSRAYRLTMALINDEKIEISMEYQDYTHSP